MLHRETVRAEIKDLVPERRTAQAEGADMGSRNYTDAELLIASQIAYLNRNGNNRYGGYTLRELLDSILERYGTYDEVNDTYAYHGDPGDTRMKAQFDTACYVREKIAEFHLEDSYGWRIVDVMDRSDGAGSGFYGCLIDTQDGNAIIGFRGSESYDGIQGFKDWGAADFMMLNTSLTLQQRDAEEFMRLIYERYGDRYREYTTTGHSLGGNLAMHAVITAPEGMRNRIDQAVSFDGPGYTDEYLTLHGWDIKKAEGKLTHIEWSWVGGLLTQPGGTSNIVAEGQDDPDAEGTMFGFLPKKSLWRHDTKNLHFDENGNVREGGRDPFSEVTRKISRAVDFKGPAAFLMLASFTQFLPVVPQVLTAVAVIEFALQAGTAFWAVVDKVRRLAEDFRDAWKSAVDTIREKYYSYAVSGTFRVRTDMLTAAASELDSAEREIRGIAEEIGRVARSIRYASIAAGYFHSKFCLVQQGAYMDALSIGRFEKAAAGYAGLYEKGDREAAGYFV